MGTIMNGILGGFSGKVGNVIGSSWNGIQYMRAVATSITQPNTPAQLEQRARFGTVGKFLRPLIPFLRIGYKNQAIKMSAFNAALVYNLENALTGVYPTFGMDYTKVRLTDGILPEGLNAEATSIVPGTIDIAWENNSYEPGAADTDVALVVVYNPVMQRAVSTVNAGTRATGSKSIVLPTSFVGAQVHCYFAFSNADQTDFSFSQYIGAVNIV